MRHPCRKRYRRTTGTSLASEALEPRTMCAADLSLSLAHDTGRLATDRLTSDATLVLSRTPEAGQRVEYQINGGEFREAVVTDGRRFVPEGIARDGSQRVVARLVDVAGDTVSTSPSFAFRVDRIAAPLQVTLVRDTGTSATDGITADARLRVTGAEGAGAVVQYSRDDGAWDPATAVWGRYAPRPGENRWFVRQVDRAGNASTPVAIEYELDVSRDERAVRIEGPASGVFTAAAGQRITWTIEFERPMHVSTERRGLPGITFTFRGQELKARLSGGGGTNRLEYSHVFTPAQAGTGSLVAPESVCLCYGGLIADAAGNRLQKHRLPPVASGPQPPV